MKERRVVALLGRRDQPTDAVEEYCRYLGGALHAHGIELELLRVPWAERGWPAALRELRQKADSWSGQRVLLQYTALMWSARGLPLQFSGMIRILREARVRLGIVFHDAEPYAGKRVIDKVRRRAQLHSIRQALHASDLAIFTVPPETLSWKIPKHNNVVSIPVGANLPAVVRSVHKTGDSIGGAPTVAIFGVTGGDAGLLEISRIVAAIRFAAKQIPQLRLVVLGRNSESAEATLRQALRDVPVDIQVLGVLPAEEATRVLAAADVLFFVRGPISSRRGSAIAGIACGLPVIAYAGAETAPPITEAGVVLVSPDSKTGFAEALVRVLTDRKYHASLAERSRLAHQRHFAWEAIAARYVEHLD